MNAKQNETESHPPSSTFDSAVLPSGAAGHENRNNDALLAIYIINT
jgi:hypothetical protein